MILSGIISTSGRSAGPPSPNPPPAPVYQIVGEPSADGTAGATYNFQASNILAQRYTAGVAGSRRVPWAHQAMFAPRAA